MVMSAHRTKVRIVAICVSRGFAPGEIVLPYVAKGRLVRVLQKFSPDWDGYHLYYPSRRQSSPAFVALVEALRHRR